MRRTSLVYAFGKWNICYITSYLDEYRYLPAAPRGQGKDYIAPSRATHNLHVAYTILDDRLALIASAFSMEDDESPYMFLETKYGELTHTSFMRMNKAELNYRMDQ